MGLVQYDSSDEDEDVQVEEAQVVTSFAKVAAPQSSDITQSSPQPPAAAPAPRPEPSAPPSPTPSEPSSLGPIQGPALRPTLGPTVGPSLPSPSAAAAEEVDLSFLTSDPSDNPSDPSADPPRSPYSAARALSRDLTLPAVPNLSIPASPTLSPHDAEAIAALNAKFDTFLQLKRRGASPAHFNARLAASSALRNPALMDKLLGFVGIEHDFAAAASGGDDDDSASGSAATAQYATTLEVDAWDPQGFPAWAYRGALRRVQEKVARERERGKGEAVEFVSAGTGTGTVEAGSAPVRGQRRTMFDT